MKELSLTNSQLKVMVDDDDYIWLFNFAKWNIHKRSGIITGWDTRKQKTVALHRLIMRFPRGLDVDHWDSNKLNCQRANLRLATDAQNAWNARKLSPAKSKYKGVCPLVRKYGWRTTWQATIGRGGGKTEYIGSFDTEIEAALAYDSAARQRYGEFAKVNFTDDPRAAALL